MSFLQSVKPCTATLTLATLHNLLNIKMIKLNTTQKALYKDCMLCFVFSTVSLIRIHLNGFLLACRNTTSLKQQNPLNVNLCGGSNSFVKFNEFGITGCFPHITCTKSSPSWQPYLSVFLSSLHTLLPTNNGTLKSQNHHCPTGLELALTSPIIWPSRLKLTDTYPRENTALSLPFPHLLFMSGLSRQRSRKKKNVSGGYWLSDIAMVMEVTTVSKGDRLAHGMSQQSLSRP